MPRLFFRLCLSLVSLVFVASACTTVEVSEQARADLKTGASVAERMESARDGIPDGWRSLPPAELKQYVSGRTFNSHYLSSNREVFQYVFNGRSLSRKRIAGGMGVTQTQDGTWSIGNDGRLCARWNVHLCYDVFTDGTAVLARRTFRQRSYVELWDPQTPGYQPPARRAALEADDVRRCAMEMSPAVQEVYTRFETAAKAKYGADFDRHPDMGPETVRNLLRTVVIEAVADQAITTREAKTMRSTLGLCFRPPTAAAAD